MSSPGQNFRLYVVCCHTISMFMSNACDDLLASSFLLIGLFGQLLRFTQRIYKKELEFDNTATIVSHKTPCYAGLKAYAAG